MIKRTLTKLNFRFNQLILLFIISFLLAGCNSDSSTYVFKKTSLSNDQIIEASFDINITKDNIPCDIKLCARFSNKSTINSLRLQITALSPSQKKYQEIIYLPANIHNINDYISNNRTNNIYISKTDIFYDIEWLYRKRITNIEEGLWKISIENRNNSSEVLGMGLRIERNNNEQQK